MTSLVLAVVVGCLILGGFVELVRKGERRRRTSGMEDQESLRRLRRELDQYQ